jgi:hypothetical protein
MRMTESSYVNPNDSHLSVLSPSPSNFFKTQNISPNKIADEIFLKSLNSSYIGTMSGIKKPIETIEYNHL